MKQLVRPGTCGGILPDLLGDATLLAPTAIMAIRGVAALRLCRGGPLCARSIVELRSRLTHGIALILADANARRGVGRDVAVEGPQADALAGRAPRIEARAD